MSEDTDFNLNDNLNLDSDLNLTDGDSNPQTGLSGLNNLEVSVTAEVGLANMPLREAEKMVVGTVVMLNKAAGELADVKINGTLIGKGQVVEKNGRYGVKITSLNSN